MAKASVEQHTGVCGVMTSPLASIGLCRRPPNLSRGLFPKSCALPRRDKPYDWSGRCKRQCQAALRSPAIAARDMNVGLHRIGPASDLSHIGARMRTHPIVLESAPTKE